MGIAHVVQTLLALAVWILCERARRSVARVCAYDARLDAAVREPSQRAHVAELAPESSAGRLARAYVEAEEEGADVGLALDHAHRELVLVLSTPLRTLRVLGRVLAMSGGLVAVGFYLKLQLFPRDLDGLIPGVLERRAAQDATLAIALGLGAAFLTLVTRLALAPLARETLQRAKKLRDALERAADGVDPTVADDSRAVGDRARDVRDSNDPA
jgi:hypothetical protein